MFDLKSIFESFLSKEKAQHETTLTMTRLASHLTEDEFQTAFVQMIKAVNRQNEEAHIAPSERLSVLLFVDDKAHTFYEKVCQEYFKGTQQASRLLPCILSFLDAMAKGYWVAVQDSLACKKKKEKPEDEAIRLGICRGLQHQLSLIKWSELRYICVDGQTWAQAYCFYQLAEQLNIHRTPKRIYSSRREVSPESLLIRAAMLSLAQTNNLKPFEIEAIDQILGMLSEQSNLSSQSQSSEFQYVINLALPQPPQLLRRGTLGDSCRYLGGMSILDRLADLILIFEKGIPSSLAKRLPMMSLEDWRHLLDKLSVRWSQDGGKSMRRFERILSSDKCYVSMNLDQIIYNLRLFPPHAGRVNLPESHWRVTDTSETGLGLVYMGKLTQDFSIDQILLIQQEDSTAILGIIKRIQSLAEGGVKLGIERIAFNPIAVTLLPTSEEDINAADSYLSLYIPRASALSGQRMFLVPQAAATLDQNLIFVANDKRYQIRIRQINKQFSELVDVDFDTLERV